MTGDEGLILVAEALKGLELRTDVALAVSVTTDIASIVADLSVLFDNRRPIEDCTTILPPKKERKYQSWEIKM